MLAIRAFVFAVYVVPDETLRPALRKGDRVVVNKIDRAAPKRGEVIVFDDAGTEYIGLVENMPGDTVALGKSGRYVIPNWHRCPKCGSDHCRNYLVRVSGKLMLVHETKITGKAKRTFNFGR